MTKKQAAALLKQASDFLMLLSETTYFVYARLDPPPIAEVLRQAGFKVHETTKKPSGEEN